MSSFTPGSGRDSEAAATPRSEGSYEQQKREADHSMATNPPRYPSAATTDPHDLAVEYIDRSIEAQVALGYDEPTAERRAAAIAAAESEFWRLRQL